MFRSARIKLTLWYLLIIGLISLFFSIIIYRGFTTEIERGLRIQAYRVLNPGLYPPTYLVQGQSRYDPKILEETEDRVLSYLVVTNLVVLVLTGFAGYFLAGLTLKPIEEMTYEQKRFIADASHELRTPLTAMKTSTEVALRDKKLDLKTTKELLGENLTQVNKMQALTTSLLTLAKYEEESGDHFEEVDLQNIAQDSLDTATPLAKLKNITIDQNLEKVIVYGDYQGLKELLLIFLDNAIKYSESGSRVVLKIERTPKEAKITVTDFGIGISETEKEHIFDRFYRAETSRGPEGYGIGLSLAQKIVARHHGTIEVVSQKGKGSTFIVNLPWKRNLNLNLNLDLLKNR